jgi:hypothetical protein
MSIVTGPWDTPTPREQDHEACHVDALNFAIGKVEADPDDIRALKDVCYCACRSPFKAVRERALEAIRVAGEENSGKSSGI